jgi:DNA-binding IclR family transcriptional regulator
VTTTNNSEIKSLSRGLNVLEILAKEPNGLPLSTIARQASYSKASTHRLLSTLILKGFVEKNNSNGKYLASIKLFILSSALLQGTNFNSIIRSYMKPLSDKTGETIHFVQLVDGSAYYIEKVESTNNIRMFSVIGKRAPFHCTGVGKAILAYLPEEKLDEILNKIELTKYTENTITNFDDLRENLRIIRNRGYALDNCEHEENICCVAVPLFTNSKIVIGAISISAVRYRAKLEIVEGWAPLLKDQAEKMNKDLAIFFERYG